MALDERNVAGAIRVEGLSELQVALRAFPREVARQFNKDMAAAVEPARQAIESRMAGISHMVSGSPWIAARTGVSVGAVYIVPRSRGSRGGKRARPNFAGLAMSEAYEPSQAEAVGGLVKAAEMAVEKAARTVSV